MDRRLLLIAPYIAWLLLLVVAPFTLVFFTAFATRDELAQLSYGFGLSAFRELLDPVYLTLLGRTAVLAGMNAVLTILAAFPMAFFLSRLPRREASWYLSLLLIPFWTNYLVRLLAFMDVLRLEPFGISWTYSFHGMLAALLYNYLPFAVLPLYATLEKVPNSLLEAAQDLGASKRRVFLRVLWPLTKRSVVSTGLLVFIPSLGEYLIPEIVGGGKSYYLGTFLQQQFLVARNWPLGSAAVVVLLLLSAAVLGFGGSALREEEA